MIKLASQKIRLLLTHRCNANCFYCHREGMSDSFEEKIDVEFVKRLLNSIECSEVILSGGEPTLHPQIEEICKEIKNQGKYLSLNTNGTQLDIIKKIMPLIDEVHISLDSLNEKIYQHIKEVPLQEPLQAIALCKKNKRPVKLNVPLSQFIDLNEMLVFAKQEGIDLRFVEILSRGLGEPIVSSESAEEKLKEVGFSLQKTIEGKKYWASNGSKVVTFKCICRTAVNSGSVEEATEICRRRTDLYVTPSGDLKPCILSSEIIPLYEHLMNGNNSKAQASIKKAVSMLGRGKCIQAIRLKKKAK